MHVHPSYVCVRGGTSCPTWGPIVLRPAKVTLHELRAVHVAADRAVSLDVAVHQTSVAVDVAVAHFPLCASGGTADGPKDRKGRSFQNFWLTRPFLTEPAQWGSAPKIRPCLELPTSVVGVCVQSKSEAKTSSKATAVQVAALIQLLTQRETRASTGIFLKEKLLLSINYPIKNILSIKVDGTSCSAQLPTVVSSA